MAKSRKAVMCPRYKELINPAFKAMQELGGSCTNDEMLEKVISMLKIPEETVDLLHTGSTVKTELDYQLAWARTYMKSYGAITNTKRSVWMIMPEYAKCEKLDVAAVIKRASEKYTGSPTPPAASSDKTPVEVNNSNEDVPPELEPWRTELDSILHAMDPFAFERLAQLLLRECGFSQVSVTKKTGDGGIDGTGKLRINGIFSFNVAFQCKRFKGSVSAGDIRDFRGSLTTNIEKGLFITTGSFTRAAREEASSAGKQQIDLIDGEEFINKLLEYRLGVKEKTVFEVDQEFFKSV